jgi:heat shock protein HslJ
MPKLGLLSLSLAALLLLAACAPVQPEAGGTVPAPAGASAAPADPAALVGTAWILDSLGGAAPLEGTNVLLEFLTPDRAAGSDGCNRFTITYLADGDSIAFQPGAAGTMMACPEPIMAQASAYFEALVSAATWAVADGMLTLADASGAPVLVFRAQPTELAGTAWQVTAYNNGQQAVVSPILGTTLTLVFGADGSLSGSAGCNNFMTSYAVTGGQVAVEPPAATRMMCAEPEGVMEQEAAFLAALASAATYTIRGDLLEFRTADGAAAIQAVPLAPTALEGTSWEVTAYNNGRGGVTSPILGTTLTMQFGADGTLSGNSGCNTYSAPFSAADGTISVGPGVSTMMACVEPEGVMEQEAEFLAALASAATYTVSGGLLELRTADDAAAVQAIPAQP